MFGIHDATYTTFSMQHHPVLGSHVSSDAQHLHVQNRLRLFPKTVSVASVRSVVRYGCVMHHGRSGLAPHEVGLAPPLELISAVWSPWSGWTKRAAGKAGLWSGSYFGVGDFADTLTLTLTLTNSLSLSLSLIHVSLSLSFMSLSLSHVVDSCEGR